MKGRCAGCGTVGKDLREHVRYCPDYLALFRAHPERALDPAAEFERWVAEERQGERDRRKERVIAEADRRRAEQTSRWQTPPDILED